MSKKKYFLVEDHFFLSTSFKSIASKVISCLCFASINGLLKLLVNIPPFQIACLTYIIASFSFFPFVSRCSWQFFYSPFFWFYGISAALATTLWIASLQHFSLFQMVATGFMNPFIQLLGAYFFLHEPLGRARIGATVLAFIGGMCLNSRFFKEEFFLPDFFSLTPLHATVLFALLAIMGKSFLKKLPPDVLSFSLLFIVGFSLLATFPWWHPLSFYQILIIGAISLLTAVAQVSTHYALSKKDLSWLTPLGIIRFLATCFVGWYFFQEMPTLWMIIGVILIAISLFWLSYDQSPSKVSP